jgi:thiamine kinase-like enzyme
LVASATVEGSTLRSAPADPDLRAVIEAMPSWASAGRIGITPIEGGITNRNYRVDVDGEAFVVRLMGADTELLEIDRDAERAAAEAAAAAGVGPEVVAYLPVLRSLVTRFIDGQPVAEEAMRDPDMLPLVVQALRAFHAGPVLPATFSPFRIVERYRETAESRGVRVPEVYGSLHERASDIERAVGLFIPRPCHNDLLNANFIRRGDRLFIVDYEYAGMGDIFFDLANFSVNNGFDDAADRALLGAYLGEATAEPLARLKLMRIMSDFREGMWGVVQQGLSTLDFDYVDYADRHLERCRRQGHDPRLADWLTAAAGEPAS